MNLFEYLTLGGTVILAVVTVLGWSAWAAWWLSKQFAQTRNLIWSKGDEVKQGLEAKLEYHEQHDDQRFASISNDLWALRVRNAARDGVSLERYNGKDQTS